MCKMLENKIRFVSKCLQPFISTKMLFNFLFFNLLLLVLFSEVLPSSILTIVPVVFLLHYAVKLLFFLLSLSDKFFLISSMVPKTRNTFKAHSLRVVMCFVLQFMWIGMAEYTRWWLFWLNHELPLLYFCLFLKRFSHNPFETSLCSIIFPVVKFELQYYGNQLSPTIERVKII